MTLTTIEGEPVLQPPFAQLLGIRIVKADAEEVVSECEVRPELTNRNGMLHGGAIMAIADNAAGTATYRQLTAGVYTVTSESKTNFFRSIAVGDTLRSVARALHKGRRTMVWQTSMYRGDGKLVAQVTQTQMLLPREDGV